MTAKHATSTSAPTAAPRPPKSAASGPTDPPSPRVCCSVRPTPITVPTRSSAAGSNRSASTSPRTGWPGRTCRASASPSPARNSATASWTRAPNFPASFVGYDVLTHYGAALADAAGRAVPLVVGNDGNMGGVAEAQRVRGGTGSSTVVMLAPGSGLGCAFVDRHGLPLDGDTLAGMEASHMPAPLHLLGVERARRAAAAAPGAASRCTRAWLACRRCSRAACRRSPITRWRDRRCR